MLTHYIQAAMNQARYKILEDGSYFGEIPDLAGIWANEATLEHCRATLQEVLEDWLILKLRDHDPIPKVGNINLDLKSS
jgi:predicted RNase H-like HicB family nuclease